MLYQNLKKGVVPIERIRQNVKATMNVARNVLEQMEGHMITFVGIDGTEIRSTKMIQGGSGKVTVPEAPKVEGYIFIGWDKDINEYDLKNLKEDLVVIAQYRKSSVEVETVTLNRTEAEVK